ncbi:MAG: site-specific DNA-methyltransferase, partial [Anaerolineales bacterium]|nr:site-specific DNA-methyltransferase [Anaerolineales bacterium]
MNFSSDDHRIQEPPGVLYAPPIGQLPLLEWYRPTAPEKRIQPQPNNGKEVEVVFRDLVPYIPSTTYGTFGLYRYPAKFIPQVVAYVIEHYGARGQSVLDPFAGCGTSGLAARLFGLNYELWDLNPLLEILHEVAITKPIAVDIVGLTQEMANCPIVWLPEWKNLSYWFSEEFIGFLGRCWGYYHTCPDESIKRLVTVPLLKLTKTLSYNDAQRQKLSRSPKAMRRVENFLAGNWRDQAIAMLQSEIKTVIAKQAEYQSLMIDSGSLSAKVRAGIDSIQSACELANSAGYLWDLLVTSPPYLQAQEYIRASKMDLFWMGYCEEDIRSLSKKELPYHDVKPVPIHSPTFEAYRKQLSEPKIVQVYERYFYGVLGALTALSQHVRYYLFLFVGPASLRAQAIPIDRIFVEHFVSLGWTHEVTLVDKIVSRVLFRSKKNPATG